MKKTYTFICLFILFRIFGSIQPASCKLAEVIALSDSIGTEIDSTERRLYHLFPDLDGYQTGRISRLNDSKYQLEYQITRRTGTKVLIRKFSKKAFELTKLHVQLAENFFTMYQARHLPSEQEAEFLYRLALKYAAETRYEMVSMLFQEIKVNYPQSIFTEKVKENEHDIRAMWQTPKALFRKGALQEQSGRVRLLIFSGYYGIWLGIATPTACAIETSQGYALGLLLGGPISFGITYNITKEANIDKARATMIILGGHLGTWQGLGWAGISHLDGNAVLGIGELLGLAGIGTSALVTRNIDFSEGHAALTSSGLEWGAWFGFVVAMIAGHKEKQVLRDMLIGSDIMIGTTGIVTRNTQMSSTRVQLINLSGVLGAVIGSGLNLLFEVNSGATAFTIAGLGSIIGALGGIHMTKKMDHGQKFSHHESNPNLRHGFALARNGHIRFTPKPTFLQHPAQKNKLIPGMRFELNF